MSEPRLPDQEEQVRRLLADARHDQPVPDDVAARLDRVLADLQTLDTPEPRGVAATADLRAVRRRRARRTLALAAAAAVVIGVGVGRLALSDGPADEGATSADSSAQEQGSAADGGGASASQRKDALKHRDQRAQIDQYAALPRVTADSFDQLARRLAARPGGPVTASDLASQALRDGAPAQAKGDCSDRAWGRGRRVPVHYEGSAAVVVVRPATDGVRVVDLYPCGADTPVRSTTVPAR